MIPFKLENEPEQMSLGMDAVTRHVFPVPPPLAGETKLDDLPLFTRELLAILTPDPRTL